MVELVGVVRLQVQLLLPSQLLVKPSGVAVAFTDHVVVRTEFVVGVPAHEVHSRQLELLVALAAVLLVKVLAGALHPLDVFFHGVDPFRHLFDARPFHLPFFVHFPL